MCYEDGGIVDDLLVYRLNENRFLLVINAANIDKDIEWIRKNNKFDVEVTNESDTYSLLAVQGPNSKSVIQKICSRDLDLEFYSFFESEISGIRAIVSRTGYTGELGYEIYFEGDDADAKVIWDAIFDAGQEYNIKPVGLAARDSLRLEMGYCLYGNDIDKSTNPIEAGLGWITKLKKGDFIGRDAILKVKEAGPSRKLTPLILKEKSFPRKDYTVSKDGVTVGRVTSGTVSPVLEQPIALAYIDSDKVQEGNEVKINIRNKQIAAQITKLPFVKN
jgi:aminomethyltransferase